MRRIRILVVDDSIIVRKTLHVILSREADLEIVGSARNGVDGLIQFQKLQPDIVTLDIMMPVMDGLETLSKIREHDKHTPIIMFSSLTETSAKATLEALTRGANDYVTKPSQSLSPMSDSTASIRNQLVPKIRSLCAAVLSTDETQARWDFGPPVLEGQKQRERRYNSPDIVAIGVSTGGPEALQAILPALPVEFPVPIVIVQHMPAIFTRSLAERLNQTCRLDVQEAQNGEVLEPGSVRFGPGDQHILVQKMARGVKIRLSSDPPVNSCRPSVDVLFRSVAKSYGRKALALVLTGMGKDGLEGARELRHAGALIYVQDEPSSVVWGMPGVIAKNHLSNKVIPLSRIAYELTRTVARKT
jgi:two-component system, chemotaxis family, protein-glutamate methylesterase/glutaminase